MFTWMRCSLSTVLCQDDGYLICYFGQLGLFLFCIPLELNMDVLTIYTGLSSECDSASEDAGLADGGLLGRLGLPPPTSPCARQPRNASGFCYL